MFKVLSQFFAQLGAIWKKIGVGQRVTIVLVGLILMVSMWALTKFAQKPHYGLLYSNISAEDSGKICSFLEDEKVAYTLKDNGRTIYVDSEKVQKMRVMLAETTDGCDCPKQELYREYVRFSPLMGLSPHRLPGTPGEFDAWVDTSLKSWNTGSYRRMALDCLTDLSPVFWPVNIAMILFLLPEEFWGAYGHTLGNDSRRLANSIQGIIIELTNHNPN